MIEVEVAQLPVLTRMIDDPVRGIETKIVVYDMALKKNSDGMKIVLDFTAQVYRRRGGVGDYAVVHTTGSHWEEYDAMQAAKKWHRRFPTVMVLTSTNGKKL